MSGVLATNFRDMTSLPPSPFPVSPAEGVFCSLATAPTSVLSAVREAERSEPVNLVDLVDLAYHAPANGTVVRQVGAELSERVKEAHRAQVEELEEKRGFQEVLKDEFEIQLGWNPDTGAMDAVMKGEVMWALRKAGAVVTIKGRFEF